MVTSLSLELNHDIIVVIDMWFCTMLSLKMQRYNIFSVYLQYLFCRVLQVPWNPVRCFQSLCVRSSMHFNATPELH